MKTPNLPQFINNQQNQDQLVNDGQRYTVHINDHCYQENYVVYILSIIDQCFNDQYKLCFRFSSMKHLHETLFKVEKYKAILPEFPKTRSFLFVNRTNKNAKNILSRARQLQYYISKILNQYELKNHPDVRHLLSKAKKSFLSKKRSKSQNQPEKVQKGKRKESVKQNDLEQKRRSSSVEKIIYRNDKNKQSKSRYLISMTTHLEYL